ncbi:MAG: septum formation protein [Bacteroidia bacterium]|jgi:septum formation protein
MHMILGINEVSLILGSKSPRRKELLAKLDVPFTTITLDVDESFDSKMPPAQVAMYLSEKKSNGYGETLANKVLITSDTTVICNKEILNKPLNKADAVKMLNFLSGRTHIVNTGVCLRNDQKIFCFYVETEVTFKVLSPEEILYYVETYKPFDKAGAYGIQEWIGMIGIEKINGCYYNVMGLPINKLYTELCTFLSE